MSGSGSDPVLSVTAKITARAIAPATIAAVIPSLSGRGVLAATGVVPVPSGFEFGESAAGSIKTVLLFYRYSGIRPFILRSVRLDIREFWWYILIKIVVLEVQN